MDSLIQRKATGKPEEFARKLNISRATLFRYIDELKNDFEAPISYCCFRGSYHYNNNFSLRNQNLFASLIF